MRQNPGLPKFQVHAPLHTGPPPPFPERKRNFCLKPVRTPPDSTLVTSESPRTPVWPQSFLPAGLLSPCSLPAPRSWSFCHRLAGSHSPMAAQMETGVLHLLGVTSQPHPPPGWGQLPMGRARPVLGLCLGPPNKRPQMGQLQTTEVYSLPFLVAGTKIKLSAGLSSLCRLQGRFFPPLLAFGGPRCPVDMAVSFPSLPHLHVASVASLSNLPRPLSSKGLCLWTKTLFPNKPVVFTGSRWTDHLGATTVPTAVESGTGPLMAMRPQTGVGSESSRQVTQHQTGASPSRGG